MNRFRFTISGCNLLCLLQGKWRIVLKGKRGKSNAEWSDPPCPSFSGSNAQCPGTTPQKLISPEQPEYVLHVLLGSWVQTRSQHGCGGRGRAEYGCAAEGSYLGWGGPGHTSHSITRALSLPSVEQGLHRICGLCISDVIFIHYLSSCLVVLAGWIEYIKTAKNLTEQ